MRGDRHGRLWHIALCALAALALTCAALGTLASRTHAQEAKPSAERQPTKTTEKTEADEKQKEEESEDYIEVISADHVDHRYGDPRSTLLEGNVHLRQEDLDLFADFVRLNQEEDTAEATGHLRVVDPENEIVADLLKADFGEARITLTGNVRLVHEGKEEEEEASGEESGEQPPAETGNGGPDEGDREPEALRDYEKKRTVLTCDQMDYYYDDKRAVCTGNVVARQEDGTVYAHRAIYDEEPDIVTLSGDVRIERKRGDLIRCKAAIISVEQNRIEAEGVTDSLILREEKKERAGEEPGGERETAGQTEAEPEKAASAPAAPAGAGGLPPPE